MPLRHNLLPACRLMGWLLLALGLPLHATLALLSFQPRDLPGCGPISDCALVLNGRWSTIAGWPVAFWGLACLSGTAMAWATMQRDGASRFLRRVVRLTAAVSLSFLGIMIFSQQYCVYCLLIHGLNLAFWILVEVTPGPSRSSSRSASSFAVGFSVVSAVLVVVQAERRWSQAEIAGSHNAPGDIVPGDNGPPTAATSATKESSSSPIIRGHYWRGAEDAAFHVVLFSDYSCTFCAEVEQQLASIVQRNNNISFSMKHYPLCTDCNAAAGSNLHPNACRAARAAEAAGILAGDDGFWRLHSWLFKRQGEFTDQQLRESLPMLGLTEELFDVMESSESNRRVQADVKEAQALRVQGTPTVYANGMRLKYWDTEASLERQILALPQRTTPRPSPP